ncbi:unnamed protein product [Ostreobium quekettii]|uniref:Uncharacterized protein n=1 Tax=Ostreobium quekettii TaxID=121088 RepID=A0A8S1J382_9CHLO|nr:unnamed protein product [Ostreobium quekettii]|eukprot:evm.model.scf_1696.4 EVM.evm.TU.scf_1696.4   scf_1696:27985-31360(-)
MPAFATRTGVVGRPGCRGRGGRRWAPSRATGGSVYRGETKALLRSLVTRQALKTLLHYLEETNPQLHYFLHAHVVEHPLKMDGSSEDWLTELAATPLTKVRDPRRSTAPTMEAEAAVKGEKEVSPRDLAERILELRAQIAQEVAEDAELMPGFNDAVLRRALAKTILDVPVDDDK